MSFEVISTQTHSMVLWFCICNGDIFLLIFGTSRLQAVLIAFFKIILQDVKISEVTLISFMSSLSSPGAVCADVWSLSSRFSEEGMEVMERLIYLFRKFNQLKVSNEEYACMKAINFLNQGESARGGTSPTCSFLCFKGWICKTGPPFFRAFLAH